MFLFLLPSLWRFLLSSGVVSSGRGDEEVWISSPQQCCIHWGWSAKRQPGVGGPEVRAYRRALHMCLCAWVCACIVDCALSQELVQFYSSDLGICAATD